MKEYLQNLICFIAVLPTIFAGELTFELPDNEKQCFHEVIDKNVKCTLEFQVYDYDSILIHRSMSH